MFLIDVIPIARGILKENLSYFSVKDIPLGSLVEVPLRNRKVSALVIDKKRAEQEKLDIKKADFSVKKIGTVKFSQFLPQEFIETAKESGKYFAGTTGAVLSAALPKNILESADKIKISKFPKPSSQNHEKLVIQAGEAERMATYKSLIREEFAKKNSVLFIAPTIEDTRRIVSILEKGIENYAFCLNSALNKKELITLWNKIISLKHPVLVVATPQFMSLGRSDFKILILEKENSSAYKQLARPFLDMRIFGEILAKKLDMRFLLGDILLRTETVWRQKNLEFAELTSLKFRSVSNAEQVFVNMRKDKKESGEFSTISKKLEEVIENAVKENRSTFVFGARKGLSPIIACKDCGKVLQCHECNSPTTLHVLNNKKRILVCHKCEKKTEVMQKCENCQSWRLEGLGVGLELIEKELKEKYPDTMVYRLDKEITKTSRGAANIISKFYSSAGSILVGSEMALLYLIAKVDNVAVASIDSLFSIPDFRISEKVLSLLLRLRSMAKRNFIIQSRHESYDLWQYALGGNLIDFYREEIKLRKNLNYPPFSTLIKITVQGQKNAVEKEMEKLTGFLKDYNPIIYPAFISQQKGKYVMHALIKQSSENWPDRELTQKLLSLSPKFMIKVDPDSIL